LGLEPRADSEDPFSSKRTYVRRQLLITPINGLVKLRRKPRTIIAEFDAPDLATLLERLGAHGVAGELKNPDLRG
jgi:hypothetical protein